MDGNDCQGHLPTSMRQMTQLRELRVRKNILSGTFPVQLKQLEELQVLDLASNHFTGTLPVFVGGALTNLRQLNVEANSLQGTLPSELGLLPLCLSRSCTPTPITLQARSQLTWEA